MGKWFRENRSNVWTKILMQTDDVYPQSLYHVGTLNGWLLSSQEGNSASKQMRRMSELRAGVRLEMYLSNLPPFYFSKETLKVFLLIGFKWKPGRPLGSASTAGNYQIIN